MKNLYVLVIAIGLYTLSSCGKGTSTSGGSWAFKTNTYDAATCFNAAPGILEADNALVSNATTYATLRCYFGGVNPTTGGTYRVVNYYSGVVRANQISFLETINGVPGTTYSSTGGSGNEMVTVTVAANGFISVSGSGVEMINGSDSSALTVSINQIQ